MTSLETELTKHLRRLAAEIGPRLQGSPQNHAAAEYIRDVFQAAGLDVEEQGYECVAWEHDTTSLELNGEKIEAAANTFSPPCDVSASSVAVGTLAELETAEMKGRIGILYGDLTKATLSAKSWFLKSERDDRMIRLLEEKAPAALITVQAVGGELVRVIEDAEFLIPSATVNARAGLALLQQVGSPVRLRIDTRRSPGRAANVVARKAGETQARIVLCAHYDTKLDTPGANDNAAGVAALLALAHAYAQSQKKHRLGLEWIAFTGEESLPMGDDEYVRRCGDGFGQIVAVINADGIGQRLGANSITMIACSQPFQDHVARLVQKYPGVVWVEPWPQSNHSTFTWRGVPGLAFSTEGGVNLAHLRTDTLEWISPAKIGEVVSLVADIVESLQDKSLDWTREPQS